MRLELSQPPTTLHTQILPPSSINSINLGGKKRIDSIKIGKKQKPPSQPLMLLFFFFSINLHHHPNTHTPPTIPQPSIPTIRRCNQPNATQPATKLPLTPSLDLLPSVVIHRPSPLPNYSSLSTLSFQTRPTSSCRSVHRKPKPNL